MRKILIQGLSAVLIITLPPLADWLYYRDRKPFVSPIYYTSEVPIRSDAYGDGRFGARRRGGRRHRGLDISAPLGEEVMAFRGGRARLMLQKGGMGKYIVIRHPGGYSTLYGHLSECLVKDRQRVRQGAVIGRVGKTGNARHKGIEPHLHFEIRKDGEYLDPLCFLL